MIERKTVLDQIEITRGGRIQVRIGLLLIDGDDEIDRKWHRTAIEPNSDAVLQMEAVNSHLDQMGRPPVSPEDIARIVAIKAALASSP